MTCILLSTAPPLVTALDPGPDLYLSMAIPGGMVGSMVSCSIYAFSPAVTPQNPTIAIYNSSGAAVAGAAFTGPPAGTAPMTVSFNVGNLPGETSGGWNAVYITVQDDTGAMTQFSPFYYYKLAPGALPGPNPGPATHKKNIKKKR
jgi:hypothetical protein